MDVQERIKTAWERAARVIRKRPAAAVGTVVTSIRLTEGLRCTIEEGPWRMIADQSTADGGEDTGPGPGFYGRASLGLCAAQGYATVLARRGLPHDGIEVRIEADYDGRGYYEVADNVPPGYRAVRYIVTVRSDAPEADIIAALHDADRHSPWLYNFTTALPVARQVELRPPASYDA
jgi:uncharacterized OsmC-like protein